MAELSGYEKFMRGLQSARPDPVKEPKDEDVEPKNMIHDTMNLVSKPAKEFAKPVETVQEPLKLVTKPKTVSTAGATKVVPKPVKVCTAPEKMFAERKKIARAGPSKMVQEPMKTFAESTQVARANPQKVLVKPLNMAHKPKKMVAGPAKMAPASSSTEAPAKPAKMKTAEPMMMYDQAMAGPAFLDEARALYQKPLYMFAEPSNMVEEDPRKIFMEGMKAARKSKMAKAESAIMAQEKPEEELNEVINVAPNPVNMPAEPAVEAPPRQQSSEPREVPLPEPEYYRYPEMLDYTLWPHSYDNSHFYAATQWPCESFTDYAARLRFLKALSSFPITDENVRYRFIMGLLSGPVRKLLFDLEMCQPTTLETVVTFAECLRYSNGASNYYEPPPRTFFDGPDDTPVRVVQHEPVILYRPRPRFNTSAINKQKGNKRWYRARLTYAGINTATMD